MPRWLHRFFSKTALIETNEQSYKNHFSQIANLWGVQLIIT